VGVSMTFPKVKKSFGRLSSGERLTKGTMTLLGASLLAAGLGLGGIAESKGAVGDIQAVSTPAGRVIVLPAVPPISITDGTKTMAGHVSHASHASHASHCSGYSYC
jgi:hypothetical protein